MFKPITVSVNWCLPSESVLLRFSPFIQPMDRHAALVVNKDQSEVGVIVIMFSFIHGSLGEGDKC